MSASSEKATDQELAELERVLDRLRRSLSPMSTMATSRYIYDVEKLVLTLRGERQQRAHSHQCFQRLATKCRTTAEGSKLRACQIGEQQLKGRLLGQAAALEYVADRILHVIGRG